MLENENVLMALFLFLSLVFSYFSVRGKTKAELIAKVREKAFQLFLHAEKQNWIGPEKMDWAAKKIVEQIPGDLLKSVIGEKQVKIWLQILYDEFKANLVQ